VARLAAAHVDHRAVRLQKVRDLHLRQLFADDPRRGERLATEAVGLYLDYSKNRITEETLRLLLRLAEERGVEMHQAGLAEESLDRLGPKSKKLAQGLTSWPDKPEPTLSDRHARRARPNFGLLATGAGLRPAASNLRGTGRHCGCADLAQPKRILVVASGPDRVSEAWLHHLP